MDWSRVVEAARALRTVPLLDATLVRHSDRLEIPGKERKTLWMEADAWRRWNRRLAAEGERVVAALEREGYRVVPIKGFDYARRLYPDVGLRPMVDIDLLLPERELGPACEFLKGTLEYREEDSPAERRHGRTYHKRILFRWEGDESRCLDMHAVFYHRELYPVDYEELWRRIGDGRAGLEPEDCLLLSCLILAKDRYQTDLRDMLDIHLMIRSCNLDWSVVLERAREWEVSVALFFSLLVVRNILGSAVPARVLEKCRPGWLRRSWLELFLATDRIPVYRFDHGSFLPKMFIRLPLADSPAGWLRFLKARIMHRVIS